MEFMDRKLRHEYKYYIHPQDYIMLRGRVSQYLAMDPHSLGNEGYVIRSVYFDGLHDQALYDKANGIFSRDKYRIRTYNGSDGTIKLERKSKFGEYVNKQAARLSREQYDRIMQGDASDLKGRGNFLTDEFYRAVAHRGFRPTVIVEYTREAYVYETEDVRITFDKRLAASVNTVDLFHPGLVTRETFDGELTVMEVKFNGMLPEAVRALVYPEAHQRSAISKYLICRETALKHYSL
jgi:hypothetical protein